MIDCYQMILTLVIVDGEFEKDEIGFVVGRWGHSRCQIRIENVESFGHGAHVCTVSRHINDLMFAIVQEWIHFVHPAFESFPVPIRAESSMSQRDASPGDDCHDGTSAFAQRLNRFVKTILIADPSS